MKKRDILFKVQRFGIKEEHELIRQGKAHEAYQIQYHREILERFVCFRSKKEFYKALEDMTTYTTDEKGFKHYEPLAFVMDEFTRNLLIDFKNKIIKK